MKKGYSLLEVIVAVFILASLVMASFSVFEAGSRQSIRIVNQMVAARLGQKICDQLHALYSAQIASISFTPFASPFDRYEYLYTVSPSGFSALPGLQKISVKVKGPVDSNGNLLIQGSRVSFTFLIARQTYTP